MEQQPFSSAEFAENPENRCPCVLICDISGSMQGDPINSLNAGLAAFKQDLVSDSLAAKRVEVSLITFATEVTTVCDFVSPGNFNPPQLIADGLTYMGNAVNLAIDAIEIRKQKYKASGVAYYRPWLFLLTDGVPNDPDWESAAKRAYDGDKAKSFAFFPIGIANGDPDFSILKQFSSREPLSVQATNFRKMFLWLSSSQKSVSRSNPGEEVKLENPTAPGGWASVS